MARLHSKKHGRSRSRHPKRWEMPEWQELSPEEVEQIILKHARQGMPPSQIGMLLRDIYGVPSIRATFKKKLYAILRREGLLKMPEDLLSLLRKAVRMHNHLQRNKKDIHNRVKYQHIVSKINRLAKYYKKKGVLDPKWKYSPESAALLVR
ncbi:MAG: 30S ribosomal protein S15 [Candidatus Micrarchaeota archaeon]|nr:30S ribosomal protein S15 [Candidatus Micrarchaeota archaeon]